MLPQDALDQCSWTKHKWKFRTNRLEEQSLEMVRVGVKKQTEYDDKEAAARGEICAAIPPSQGDIGADAHPRPHPPPPTRGTATDIAARRQSDRRHGERIELANDKIHCISRPDRGWVRDREISEKLHGAARDREGNAWGWTELDDDAIYGAAGVEGGGRRGRRGGGGGGGQL